MQFVRSLCAYLSTSSLNVNETDIIIDDMHTSERDIVWGIKDDSEKKNESSNVCHILRTLQKLFIVDRGNLKNVTYILGERFRITSVDIVSSQNCRNEEEPKVQIDYSTQFIMLIIGVAFTTTVVTLIMRWYHRRKMEAQMRERKEGCCNHNQFQYQWCDKTVPGGPHISRRETCISNGEVSKTQRQRNKPKWKVHRTDGMVVYIQEEDDEDEDNESVLEYSPFTAASSRSKRQMKRLKLDETNHNSRKSNTRDTRVELAPITEENEETESKKFGTGIGLGFIMSIYGLIFECNLCAMLSDFGQRLLYSMFDIS